ncbi:MAG: 3-deoxy-manno-octulosonate cytidylyltransferase [Lachnospiraceae bacterium]|nr:3-deoxy-manno-octulosonate cytidylyltransferase [Lachnospiraceae bacterium]
MNTVIVIPARYASTRLPGKPLMDIGGKPMIWWVYEKCKRVSGVAQVIVATDSTLISDECKRLGMQYIITAEHHTNHVMRLAEVAESLEADYYVCVNGDEPLVDEYNIQEVIPDRVESGMYAGYSIRPLTSIAEATDTSNIKVVRKINGDVMYLSRMIIPYPKGGGEVQYFKLVGIECFNKRALQFYASTPMSPLERIEDIDHLRFIEHGIPIHTTIINSESISVDTPKDLEYVRKMLCNE